MDFILFTNSLSHLLLMTVKKWIPLILSLSIITHPVLAATPSILSKTEYSYQNTPASLENVLRDFANAFSFNLVIDKNVSGVVKNKVRSATALEFIERLALEYRLQWFFFEDKFYVSSKSKQQSVKIKVAQHAIDNLKTALTDIGLLDTRFGWGELPDSHEILVSGPVEYVNLIKKFAEQPEATSSKKVERGVMFFPLHYAEAADRQIKYQNETITTPGVGTILHELLTQKQAVPFTRQFTSPVDENLLRGDAITRTLQPLLSNYSNLLIPGVPGQNANEEKPRVVVDSRNNAVLIYDELSKRAEYAQLIEKLDVNLRIIAVDMMVVEIDRSQITPPEVRERRFVRPGSVYEALMNGNKSIITAENMKRFETEIRQLVEQGGASLVARPSIITTENFPAVTHFNQQMTGSTKNNPSTDESGTYLNITPRLIADAGKNFFQLKVSIQDKNGASSSTKESSIETIVAVGEGDSLVISGLSLQKSSMFSANLRESKKRARFLIMTPKMIYTDATDAAKLAAAKTAAKRKPLFTEKTYKKIFQDIVKLANLGNSLNAQPQAYDLTIQDVCDVGWPFTIVSGNVKSLANSEYKLFAALIKNGGQQAAAFNEADCDNNENMIVIPYPDTSVLPGSLVEIYIARKADADK